MDRPKLPVKNNKRILKIDSFTIINKRFTLAFLMFIGLAITFCGITLSHVNKCLTTSIEPDHSSLYVSSFLLGYVIIQIPAAWCSLKFSPITWFGRSILTYSILLCVLAFFKTIQYEFWIAFKLLEGLISGTIIVMLHAAWKNWAPSAERSTLITFPLAGCYLGDFFGEVASKYCSELPVWIILSGILGGIGVIWWAIWESMVYETPEKHRTITEKEYYKIYPTIREELELSENVPCTKIIFSMPFLVLIIVNLLRAWNSGFYLYKKEHMYIILLMNVFTFPIAGYLADVLAREISFTITYVRKLYITGIFLLEVIYFLILRYGNNDWIYIFSFIMHILHITAMTAVNVNAVDIAPNHAGVTIAIVKIFSQIGYQVPFKIEHYLYEINWLDTFYFVSIIAHLIGAIAYGIYGTAKPITAKK